MFYHKITKKIMAMILVLQKHLIWNSHRNKKRSVLNRYEDREVFLRYRESLQENENVVYEVRFESIPLSKVNHKWVGGQYIKGMVVGIPNDMSAFLQYNGREKEYIGSLSEGKFKWTGGCVYEGFLYGFPRTSNMMLKLDLQLRRIEYMDIKEKYRKEHHYGGVCTKDGVVYQPPRDTDHILVWYLENGENRRIQIAPRLWGMKLRYCGSIIHPNGYAYFFPEKKGKVIKLDLKTEKWVFIGRCISTMVFDAKIAIDGNIYGFSAYYNGLLKIDVLQDEVSMIHTNVSVGAYGTKLGVNGHLYSVPGDGNILWEYDVKNDSIKQIYNLKDSNKAKYAGGVTTKQGNIYMIPATADSICQLVTNGVKCDIPEDIYSTFFVDCY